MITKKYLKLIIWILALQLISGCLGIITKSNMQEWYFTIQRSSLTPPGYIFGIVWPILYILIAIYGWIIWNNSNNLFLKNVFIFQLILNWLWTPVFFHFHLTLLGTIFIAFIIICLLLLSYFSYKDKEIKYIHYLLLPYFIWSCFALYLNFYIVLNN